MFLICFSRILDKSVDRDPLILVRLQNHVVLVCKCFKVSSNPVRVIIAPPPGSGVPALHSVELIHSSDFCFTLYRNEEPILQHGNCPETLLSAAASAFPPRSRRCPHKKRAVNIAARGLFLRVMTQPRAGAWFLDSYVSALRSDAGGHWVASGP